MLSLLDVAALIRKNYPHYPLPSMQVPKLLMYLVGPIAAGLSWHYISHNIGHQLQLDTTNIRTKLALTFPRSMETTFSDMIESLVAHGIVEKR